MGSSPFPRSSFGALGHSCETLLSENWSQPEKQLLKGRSALRTCQSHSLWNLSTQCSEFHLLPSRAIRPLFCPISTRPPKYEGPPSHAGQEQLWLPGWGCITHRLQPQLCMESSLSRQTPKSINYFFCFQALTSSLLFSLELKLTQTDETLSLNPWTL